MQNFIAPIVTLLTISSAQPLCANSIGALSGVDGHSTAAEAVEAPSELDLSEIEAAVVSARHAPHETTDGFVARNPGQGLTIRFDDRGATATPATGGWEWGLELLSWGFADSPSAALNGALNGAAVTAESDRVSFEWGGGLTEWWRNDPGGPEHGFTVHERPSRASEGDCFPLEFTLAVRGGLRPEVSADRRSARFDDPDGKALLSYSGLIAYDADGKDLDAWIEATEETLRVCVAESTARYPVTVDPVVHTTYLKPSESDLGDLFGSSVAVFGDTVVVGVENDDGPGSSGSCNSGAAYVFVKDSTGWEIEAVLRASISGCGFDFGTSCAIDGDTIVIGAHERTSRTGAAFVFVRTGTTWSEQAFLTASNADVDQRFGFSVDVCGDTIVVGADGEEGIGTGVNGSQVTDSNYNSAGAAYVFVRTGTSWSQEAYLKASNTDPRDFLGRSVAVSGDVIVVGAYRESSSATGMNGNQADNSANESGAVYVFERSGSTWSQAAYVKASNADGGDRFGESVSISGGTFVVGALREDSASVGVNGDQGNGTGATNSSGAAYVFERSGMAWSQEAYVKASNTQSGDAFGYPVAVSGDTLVVGAIGEASASSGVDGDQSDNSASLAGAAYVFTRTGSTWSQEADVKATNTDADDRFASSVGVDGHRIVIGAPYEDSASTVINGDQNDNSRNNTGASYILDLGQPIGQPLCSPAVANSTGASAMLSAFGSDVAIEDHVTLAAASLPMNSTGFFLTSQETNMVMNPGGSTGNICIASYAIGRYDTMIQDSGLAGAVALELDLGSTPIQPGGPIAIVAGETWCWQYWYRDMGASGMPTSNFTDAICVRFD